MPDRATSRGVSGWGYNAREPWASPLFAPRRAPEPARPPVDIRSLVTATLLALLTIAALVTSLVYLLAP